MDEKEPSKQAVANFLRETIEKITKEGKSADEPFKTDKSQTEKNAERFAKLITRPNSKVEINKTMKAFKTGTFLDDLFLNENEEPLGGIPLVVQMGIVGLPDVGKSVLGQEIALRVANEGKRVVFITSEDIWDSQSARFDLQSRMKQKADKMGLDWETIRNSLFVFDTITHSELRDWETFVETYRYIVEILGGVDLLILDSITLMESYRGALKKRVMSLSEYNQKMGITAIYVSQRSLEEADKYAMAGGIGLAHNLDATVCIDFKKASGRLKADLNAKRGKDEQLKQYYLVHFVRVLGCRLCGFDRKYHEVEITQDGFVRMKYDGIE